MKIRIKSPASLSNLVAGYDIFGMALQDPYDIIELETNDSGKISITHLDDFGLPEDVHVNIAGISLQSMASGEGLKNGFDIKITKNIKPGSGIGSSAASAAGIVLAADMLLNLNLPKDRLLQYAMDGESSASGSRHADNIAPVIYGGLTLIRDASIPDIIKLDTPEMHIVVLHPQIEVKTSYARGILPKDVPLKDAVKQWANASAMVAAFMKNDMELLKRSMEDFIVEPVRKKLIPFYDEVKNASLNAGAIGGGISGSGPSMFMFCDGLHTASRVEMEMKKVYSGSSIDFKTYVTQVNTRGVISY